MNDAWIKPFEASFPPAETIIIPAEGYRIWFVPTDDLRLKSITTETSWPPLSRLEAECSWSPCVCKGTSLVRPSYHNDSQNTMSCNAGIYGMKTFEQGLAAFERHISVLKKCKWCLDPVNRAAFGTVHLWGKVLECEKGFRAQYAYPAGIFDTAPNSAVLAVIYRVPLLEVKSTSRRSAA